MAAMRVAQQAFAAVREHVVSTHCRVHSSGATLGGTSSCGSRCGRGGGNAAAYGKDCICIGIIPVHLARSLVILGTPSHSHSPVTHIIPTATVQPTTPVHLLSRLVFFCLFWCSALAAHAAAQD